MKTNQFTEKENNSQQKVKKYLELIWDSERSLNVSVCKKNQEQKKIEKQMSLQKLLDALVPKQIQETQVIDCYQQMIESLSFE